MSFLISTVSQTADGRRIVRATEVAKDRVAIGRNAENDIALADLGVSPQHAVVERRDDRRIAVTASGTLDFSVDGRRTTSATIDAARGAEIGIGGHRITVARDDKGRVTLSIERVELLADSAEERDEARAFSLRPLLPGKRASSWVLVVAILAAFLAWPIWSFTQSRAEDRRNVYTLQADRNWSSGPLSIAHHGLEGQCTACHQQAFVSVRDTSCTACHKDTHDHAAANRLAGGRAPLDFQAGLLRQVAASFNKPGPGACVDCHTEHEGAGPMRPTPQAFCADCHATLKSRLTDTKIANAADFGTAHPQFRAAVTPPGGALVRMSLDTRPTDFNGLKFPHKLHLDTRGGVARMAQTLKAPKGYGDALACADCHRPTADGVRFLPVDMERDCAACHSLAFDRIGGTVRTLRHGDPKQMMADLRALYRNTGPASPPQLGGMARRQPGNYAQGKVYHAYFGAVAARPAGGDAAIRAVFSKDGACYDCHVITPPGVAGATDWTVMPVRQPARYMMNGWFDHAAHKTEKCESCHAARASTDAQQLLLPGIKTCRSCHAGEGAVRAKVPSSCALCHSYHIGDGSPWRPRRSIPRSIALMSHPPGGSLER